MKSDNLVDKHIYINLLTSTTSTLPTFSILESASSTFSVPPSMSPTTTITLSAIKPNAMGSSSIL